MYASMASVIVAAIGLIGTVAVKLLDRPATTGTPGTRARGRRSPRMGILLYVFAGMLVGGGAVAAVPRFTARQATQLRITSPREGARVEMQETIRGTSRNLPAGDSVWLVIFIPDAGRYYPQDRPADVQAGGGWNSPAHLGLGDDGGRRFEVLAVAADAPTRAAFGRYLAESARGRSWPGIERLPATAREFDRVAVIRR
jgi:hypothetical protein